MKNLFQPFHCMYPATASIELAKSLSFCSSGEDERDLIGSYRCDSKEPIFEAICCCWAFFCLFVDEWMTEVIVRVFCTYIWILSSYWSISQRRS